jgi:hypothetical protein
MAVDASLRFHYENEYFQAYCNISELELVAVCWCIGNTYPIPKIGILNQKLERIRRLGNRVKTIKSAHHAWCIQKSKLFDGDLALKELAKNGKKIN